MLINIIIQNLIYLLQVFFLLYMFALGMSYLALNLVSLYAINKHMQKHRMDYLMDSFSEFQPPISILVPAYNEAGSIETNILSLTQLMYTEYEIIVINDGSVDGTLKKLIDAFKLVPVPQAYPVRIKSKEIKGFYQSTQYSNLRVLDKINGGKADALNAGINASRYPLFCSIDADSILQSNSLNRISQPFLHNPATIAAGGTIRIVNGSKVADGVLVKADLPKSLLAQIQIVEYLRAFLFGRLGWTTINSMLVISGAFGLFHKQSVMEVGGYKSGSIGEDMELIVRLHKHFRLNKKKYSITFVPDPICWTEVPEDLRSLKNQRIRWQVGLYESLSNNSSLLFNRKGGAVGNIAFPYMVIFELFGPLIEVTGYLFIIIGFIFNVVTLDVFLLFFSLSVGLGMMVSVVSLLLEELSFHIYTNPKQILRLYLVAIFENFGYRQLNTLWRLEGLIKTLFKIKIDWGIINRVSTWHIKIRDIKIDETDLPG